MNYKKGIITILSLQFFLFGCSQTKDNNKEESIINQTTTIEISEKDTRPLDIVNRRDTLIITFHATECGEWGGHQETIYLQRSEDNNIKARIIIDSVPCDDIIEKDGVGILNPKKRKIITDTTKILNLDKVKIISEFLQRLLELYLKPYVVANMGSGYIVRNTDNSLYFNYWNSGNIMDTHYFELKKEIFGKMIEK